MISTPRPFRPRPLFALLAAALSLAPALPASANDPGADGLIGRDVRSGVAAGGKLWISSFGALVAIDEATNVRHVEIPNGLIDVAKWKGEVWALRRRADLPAPSPAQARYSAYVVKGVRMFELPPVLATTAEGPQGLAMSASGPRLVGRTTLWTLDRNASRWRETRLRREKAPAPPGVMTLAATTDGSAIFVGWNAGEWGGRLERINTATGAVTTRTTAPVTGLVADPQHPGCVLAAYGLSHLGMTMGQLARVCGDAETPVLQHKVGEPAAGQSEPIFGIAADGDTIWAVSGKTLYRLSPKGQDSFPLGEWVWLSDLKVTRPAPGAILVLTDLNAHFSTSGSTPLVIADP
ncbi:MAG TPA: hypothetical protein VF459_07940 [Caulobacteraceae bacterium]